MAFLSIKSLTKRFGGLVANQSITFDVPEGGLYAVIGPNGAGKTTLFNMVAGSLPPTSGHVEFRGEAITGLPQHRIAGKGLIRTHQLVKLFGGLSAEENVLVGFHLATKGGPVQALLNSRATRLQEAKIKDRARELLSFVGLGGRGEALAGKLTYGEQRLLEIARALAASPQMLLLDEPAAGLNPHETDALATTIIRINDGGTAVLLIEHDMSLVMRIAQRVIVLDLGEKISEGPPAEVQGDPKVLEAYLGAVGNLHA